MENNNLNCFGGSSISGETTKFDVTPPTERIKWVDELLPIGFRVPPQCIASELVSVVPMEQPSDDWLKKYIQIHSIGHKIYNCKINLNIKKKDL